MKYFSRIETLIISILLICGTFAVARGGILPKYNEFSLSNGMKVVLVEDHRQPLIDFRLTFDVGSASDSSRYSGLAAVSSYMFKEATENFTVDELLSAINETGGNLEVSYLRDVIFIQGNFLARDFDFAMKMLAEIIRRSRLTDDGFERRRRRLLSYTLRDRSIIRRHLINNLYNAVYGDEGYGLPITGTQSGLRKIKLDDVRRFFAQNIHPNNSRLVIAGDFDASTAKKVIKKLFSDWESGSAPSMPIVNEFMPDSLRIILLDNPDAAGSDYIIGRPAVPRNSESTASLLLLNYILGRGGEVSRLYKRLVSEQKLVTNIWSEIDWSRRDGMILIGGTTSNEMAAEAVRQTLAVMNELKSMRVSAAELEEAKNFYRGNVANYFENGIGTVNHISYILSWGETLDHYDRILKAFDSITPSSLKKTADRFLNENRLTVIVSGRGETLKRQLSDIAPVEVIGSGQE
jgi:zinc protease